MCCGFLNSDLGNDLLTSPIAQREGGLPLHYFLLQSPELQDQYTGTPEEEDASTHTCRVKFDQPYPCPHDLRQKDVLVSFHSFWQFACPNQSMHALYLTNPVVAVSARTPRRGGEVLLSDSASLHIPEMKYPIIQPSGLSALRDQLCDLLKD